MIDPVAVTMTGDLRRRMAAAITERFPTQEEAAAALGVSQGMVSRFLSGKEAWSALARWEDRLRLAGLDPSGLLDHQVKGLSADEAAALQELGHAIANLPQDC